MNRRSFLKKLGIAVAIPVVPVTLSKLTDNNISVGQLCSADVSTGPRKLKAYITNESIEDMKLLYNIKRSEEKIVEYHHTDGYIETIMLN